VGRANRLSACVAVLPWVAVRVTLPAVFERYTEKARRTIFFARYEASQFGSPYIETEHLLLGLIREDQLLTVRFLEQDFGYAKIRQQIENISAVREAVSTSVDLPLSNECKRVLAYAAEESERLANKEINTGHLLLGLLREERCFAATILHEHGLTLEAARNIMGRPAPVHSRKSEEYVVTFVDMSGKILSKVSWTIPVVVPRVGEHVHLAGRSFRVRKVGYHFSKVSQEPHYTVDRLYKIEITLAKNDGDDPKRWSEAT
jgi:hypothetical protein